MGLKPEIISNYYNCAEHFDKRTSNTVDLSLKKLHQFVMIFTDNNAMFITEISCYQVACLPNLIPIWQLTKIYTNIVASLSVENYKIYTILIALCKHIKIYTIIATSFIIVDCKTFLILTILYRSAKI